MTRRVVVAEVLEPEESLPSDLRALLRFARVLDEAVTIPGTRKKVGLDAAVGLIPGVGDAVGALFSLSIVLGALRHRVPLRVLLRMIWNIGVDLVIGLIPVAGDIFDIFFAENMGNVRLLIANRDRTRAPRSWGSIAAATALVSGVVILMSISAVVLLVWVVLWLIAQR